MHTSRPIFRLSLIFPALALIFFSASPLSPDINVSICRIQGDGAVSPRLGDYVTTSGVVYADLDDLPARGFYLQHDGCDTKPATSDGIFVELSARGDLVDPGDRVEVSGVVQEYFGRTQLYVRTERVTLISHANPLPLPVDLSPPFEAAAAAVYFEQLENMHVRLDAAVVVGPTGDDGRTRLLRLDLGLARLFNDHPGGVAAAICAGDGGRFAIAPPAVAGDRIAGLRAALDFSREAYCLRLLDPPALTPGGLTPAPAADGLPGLTVASFNLANLFDVYDDPATDDTVLTTAEVQRRLYKRAYAIRDALGEPAILAVQEVENTALLRSLTLDTDVLRSDYRIVHFEGPDRRGLESALLVRYDRLAVLAEHTFQSCTTLVDGFGPDGNDDPLNPVNLPTCDTDGDGVNDGNRLFSRPPLAVYLSLGPGSGQPAPAGEGGRLWVIAAHLKSKVGDSAEVAYTQPRRIREAAYIAALALNLRAAYPGGGVLLLGDLNDVPGSEARARLTDAGFVDLAGQIPPAFRYTYINQGVSQVLDGVLWLPSLSLAPQAVAAAHINADFPAFHAADITTAVRSSDHDPLWARFGIAARLVWLPLVRR